MFGRPAGWLACALLVSSCSDSKHTASAPDGGRPPERSAATTVASASPRPTATASGRPEEGSVLAFYAVDDADDYFASFTTDAPASEVEIEREGGSWAPGTGVRMFVIVRTGAAEATRRREVEKKLLELAPKDRTIGWAPLHKADRKTGEPTRYGSRTYLLAERFITERDIAEAAMEQPLSAEENFAVRLKLTPEGRRKNAEWTAKLTKRRMAIVSEGEVHSVPYVTGPIEGDTVVLTVGGLAKQSRADAQALVAKIQAANR